MPTQQDIVRSLLEQLITHETRLSNDNDPENFAIARDYALAKFKSSTFVRTNQFEVISRLEGLVEKFYIANADDLAEALEERIRELPSLSGSSYVPEVLHLLLELSDDPLHKASVEDLERLKPPTPPKELTWERILEEEPLEGEIWKDVDFGAESSDAWSDDEEAAEAREGRIWERVDKNTAKRRRKKKGSFDAQEVEEEYRVKGIGEFVVEGDVEGLERLKEMQYWERRVVPKPEEVDVSLSAGPMDDLWLITELQALREVIFMLLGHPSNLFRLGKDGDPGLVWVDENAEKRFVLGHMSTKGFASLLEQFAEKGSRLNRIRRFTRGKEEIPERQSFIAAIETKLDSLDKALVAIEENYVGEASGQVTSLLALQSQLEPILLPFEPLAKVVDNVDTPLRTSSTHLEELYRCTCDLQSTSNKASFTFVADIFFACLKTYLRPIRLWMESGILPPTADFLILKAKADEEVELGSLWYSQYQLNRPENGVLNAPSFVHPVSARILTTGKSVVFLKRLSSGTTEFDENIKAKSLDDGELLFDQVCPPGSELASFDSLFSVAFNRWISARHHSISSRLREHLFTSCGLWKSLHALDTIFFSRNGYLFEALAQAIFERLDRRSATWSDRFLLTELIQGVFMPAPEVHWSKLRLCVRKDPGFRSSRVLRQATKSVLPFELFQIEYRLPWPVMNIIQTSTLETYRNVFSFLLQLRRCKYLLERLNLIKDATPSSTKGAKGLYLSLKQRLLWFINAIFAYLTDQVLRPQTEELRAEMRTAPDVDGMCLIHNGFVQKIREMCLLGSKLAPIHDAIVQAMSLVVRFTNTHVQQYVSGIPEAGGERAIAVPFLPTPRHLRKRRGSDESSGDEELPSPSAASVASETVFAESDEEDEDEDISGAERYRGEMWKMREEFAGLVKFVRSGLRGVARAGVMPHLECLAEVLEGYAVAGTIVGTETAWA